MDKEFKIGKTITCYELRHCLLFQSEHKSRASREVMDYEHLPNDSEPRKKEIIRKLETFIF